VGHHREPDRADQQQRSARVDRACDAHGLERGYRPGDGEHDLGAAGQPTNTEAQRQQGDGQPAGDGRGRPAVQHDGAEQGGCYRQRHHRQGQRVGAVLVQGVQRERDTDRGNQGAGEHRDPDRARADGVHHGQREHRGQHRDHRAHDEQQLPVVAQL